MKKIIAFFFILTMSLASVSVNAQSGWLDLYTPETITAITINDTEMAIFGLGQYYVSPVSSSPEWSARVLPLNEQVMAAEFVADELFVLFTSGNLYRLNTGIWDLVLTEINGISQNSGHLFAWSADWIFEYNDSGWQYQVTFDEATYVAGGNTTIVSTNFIMYQGVRPDELFFLKDLDMTVKEILITYDQYIYVGKVTGDLAAYHISPLNFSYIYDHILTNGVLNSAAQFNGNIYVAGRLGGQGVIFDAQDMSRIDWWPEEIIELRASDAGMLALGIDALHLKLGTSTSSGQLLTGSDEQYGSLLEVLPNPIEEGKLRLVSEDKTEAQIISLDGRQISRVFIEEGVNIFNVQDLRSGMYIISSPKGTAKFLIK
ncbi:MAG: T9SS type A sorting domain-containing protein [Bacteroidales bacterium]|jgi:hypothetical protein|nr:T9SS type A sorting domain-containing protein [Bacteroidales bacterium]